MRNQEKRLSFEQKSSRLLVERWAVRFTRSSRAVLFCLGTPCRIAHPPTNSNARKPGKTTGFVGAPGPSRVVEAGFCSGVSPVRPLTHPTRAQWFFRGWAFCPHPSFFEKLAGSLTLAGSRPLCATLLSKRFWAGFKKRAPGIDAVPSIDRDRGGHQKKKGGGRSKKSAKKKRPFATYALPKPTHGDLLRSPV